MLTLYLVTVHLILEIIIMQSLLKSLYLYLMRLVTHVMTVVLLQELLVDSAVITPNFVIKILRQVAHLFLF